MCENRNEILAAIMQTTVINFELLIEINEETVILGPTILLRTTDFSDFNTLDFIMFIQLK